MKVTAESGLKDIEAFGWGDYTTDTLLMLKDAAAKYYLVVTDINGNDVSIEIPAPEGVELCANSRAGWKAAKGIKIPVTALEIEVPGEPSVELLGPSEARIELVIEKPKPKKPDPNPKAGYTYKLEFPKHDPKKEPAYEWVDVGEVKVPPYLPPQPPPPAGPKQKPLPPPAPRPSGFAKHYIPKPGANSYPGTSLKVKVYYDQSTATWTRETFDEVTGEGTKEVVTEEQMRRGAVPGWLSYARNGVR